MPPGEASGEWIRAPSMTRRCCEEALLQVRGDLVDTGLGASLVLVAARCAGNTDGTDGVVADLDRQRALRRNDVGEPQRTGVGVALDAFGEVTGGPAEGAGRIGLL